MTGIIDDDESMRVVILVKKFCEVKVHLHLRSSLMIEAFCCCFKAVEVPENGGQLIHLLPRYQLGRFSGQ